MLKIIYGGSEGIAKMDNEARELGFTLNDNTVKSYFRRHGSHGNKGPFACHDQFCSRVLRHVEVVKQDLCQAQRKYHDLTNISSLVLNVQPF